jgi:ABC-type lipoprotein export system ATPase subunit/GNAT superfamily N-acetyltransferase
MPRVDLVVETPISTSARARQVCSMFDVPPAEKCRLEWHLDVDLESRPWSVGLVVGPSGSGKTSVMRALWGEPRAWTWGAPSVIDDFAGSVEDVAGACSAVGFNTIPAWLRPFAVLSNGERFRAELARHLLSDADPIVVDEFSSVVDRQVAQIAAHAVQKRARRLGRRFVAVTCHYDVADWLQPDWVLDMATRSFTRRSLQRRPPIECVIRRVPHATWSIFAPFHYLTADLHRAARCFALFAGGRLAAFAGLINRPHPRVRDIIGCARLVTLPDWQGLGLAMALIDELGAAHKALDLRLHTYPAHPALVRTFARSPRWRIRCAGGAGSRQSARTSARTSASSAFAFGGMGQRPCATFAYDGPAWDSTDDAIALLR